MYAYLVPNCLELLTSPAFQLVSIVRVKGFSQVQIGILHNQQAYLHATR